MRLTVIHHNGVKYMPIHRGIVVPADFPLLQNKAEVMQRLGDRFEIGFEKKNCRTYGKKLFGCSQGKVIADGVTSATGAGLLTRTATEPWAPRPDHRDTEATKHKKRKGPLARPVLFQIGV